MITTKDSSRKAPRLSLRQQQILHYIIMGYHNKTIAHLLGIQLVTVKMHVGLLFRKLGVSNRTEAAVLGVALYGVDSIMKCDAKRFPAKSLIALRY